jgi:hypothetical protein
MFGTRLIALNAASVVVLEFVRKRKGAGSETTFPALLFAAVV